MEANLNAQTQKYSWKDLSVVRHEYFVWLGWQDSNLRMTGSKPVALPLGYIPFTSHEQNQCALALA